jgi:hypothetical protein
MDTAPKNEQNESGGIASILNQIRSETSQNAIDMSQYQSTISSSLQDTTNSITSMVSSITERSKNSEGIVAVKKPEENDNKTETKNAPTITNNNPPFDFKELQSIFKSFSADLKDIINNKSEKNKDEKDDSKNNEKTSIKDEIQNIISSVKQGVLDGLKSAQEDKEKQKAESKKNADENPDDVESKNKIDDKKSKQNKTGIADAATQNKINQEKNVQLKAQERSISILDSILATVKKIDHDMSADRLDQQESNRETDKKTLVKQDKKDEAPEKKGIFSALWDTLKNGIGGLLNLIPGFKTLTSLIGPVVGALGTLVTSLAEFATVLLSPGFAAIGGIVIGMGAIAFELYKAKQLIDETDKLHQDTIKLNMQLAQQAGDAKKAKELQAQLEKEQTGSVSTLTERDRQQAEYLETKQKLEVTKEKLKDVPQFLQSRSRMGEPMMPKDNPAYIKLQQEIEDLQKQADEQYKKTEKLTDKSKFNIDENGFMTSKNPFEKASTGPTISQTLEDFFYQNSKNGMRTPKLAPAPEQQSLGQDMYDYSTNWLNGPADNMEPSGNFRRMMGPPNTIKGVSSKESNVTPAMDNNARLKLQQTLDNLKTTPAMVAPTNIVTDNSNKTFASANNAMYRAIPDEARRTT